MDTDSLHQMARDPDVVHRLAERSLEDDECGHMWAVDLLKTWGTYISRTPSGLARLVGLLQGVGRREQIVVGLHAGIVLALRHPTFSLQVDQAIRAYMGLTAVAVFDREADAYAELGAKVRAEVLRLVGTK